MKVRGVLFSLVVLVCSFSIVKSQVEIAWGKEFPMPKISSRFSLEGFNNNVILGAYITGIRRGNVEFYRFDKKNLSFSGVNPSVSSLVIKPGDYYKTLSIHNQLIMLYRTYQKDAGKYVLFALKIGGDGKPAGDFFKLLEMDAVSKRNRGDYEVITCVDSTKFCVIASPSYEKGTNEKLVLVAYDGNLKKLVSNQVELTYKDQMYIPGNFIYASDGDLIMQATVYVPKKDRSKDDARTFPSIFKLDPATGKMDEYQIKIPGINIADLDMSLDPNGKLIVAGFYADPKQGGKRDLDGIVYLRINRKTKEIEKSSMYKLPDDVVAEIIGDRKAKKGKGIGNDFRINYLISLANGSQLLLGERYYSYVVTTCDTKGNCTTTTYYVHSGIIAINISKDGNILWSKLLPMKQQFANSDAFGSYTFAQSDKNIFILYNDLEKNRVKNLTKFSEVKTLGNPKRMVTALVALDFSGNFTIQQAFDPKLNGDKKYYLIPKSAIHIEKNVLVTVLTSLPGFCNFYCTSLSCGIVKSKKVAKICTLTFK